MSREPTVKPYVYCMWKCISGLNSGGCRRLTTVVVVIDDAWRSRGGAAQVPILLDLARAAGGLAKTDT